MEHNTVISTVGEAFSFAVIGFLIVMLVLFIVILCITAVMKLEPVLFKEKKKVPPAEEGIDPLVLVLITAAVAAHYKSFRIQNIRIGKRKDSVWNEIGRSSHHGSHVIK